MTDWMNSWMDENKLNFLSQFAGSVVVNEESCEIHPLNEGGRCSANHIKSQQSGNEWLGDGNMRAAT